MESTKGFVRGSSDYGKPRMPAIMRPVDRTFNKNSLNQSPTFELLGDYLGKYLLFSPLGWWTFDGYDVSKGLVQPPTSSIFSRTNKPFKLLFHGPLAESASKLFGYFWSIISADWSFHTDFKSHSFEMFLRFCLSSLTVDSFCSKKLHQRRSLLWWFIILVMQLASWVGGTTQTMPDFFNLLCDGQTWGHLIEMIDEHV